MLSNKFWKATMYLRISKEDTDKCNWSKESNSIANQRDLIQEYLKNHSDIKICSERLDDGWSGVNFQRPAFQAMMQDIRTGKTDCIIVKDLSRFGRNHIEAGNYIEKIFPILGVRFISINDGFDSLNPKTFSDQILIPFKNLINDAYSRDISVKIRSQLQIKRKKGDFIGAFAPYGYQKSEENKNKLVVDETASEVIQEIFRLKLLGMSADAIANKLNFLGIPSPLEYKKQLEMKFITYFQHNPHTLWSATSVLRILRNPLYIGTLTQGKEGTPNHKIQKKSIKPKTDWVIIEDNHEPIISKDIFFLTQQLLKSNTRTSPNEQTVHLFSGMLYCSHCGNLMIRKSIPNIHKKYIYYVCSKHKKNKACRIREDVIIDSIFTSLKKQIEIYAEFKNILSYINEIPFKNHKTKRMQHQLKQKNEELNRYLYFKEKLYESYMDDIISKEDYEMFYTDYTNQCDLIKEQMISLKQEIEQSFDKREISQQEITYLKMNKTIKQLSRPMLITFIEKILVYDKNTIEIFYRFPMET